MRLARVVPALVTAISLAITSCAWFREPPIWVVTQVSHHGAYLQAAINTERGGLTFVFEPTDGIEHFPALPIQNQGDAFSLLQTRRHSSL